MGTTISDFGIDVKTRFLVLYLDAEMKPSRISRLIGKTERTIKNWIEKTDSGEDVRIVKRRGTKAKVDQKIKKKIMRQVSESPHRATTRKLAARNDLSKSTIHNIIVEKGYKYGNNKSLPQLTDAQRDDRVDFCEYMTANHGDKIYETFYSDEMGIRLSKAKKDKHWYAPGKKIKTEKPVQDVKLNCWGAISYRGATSLEIFHENLDHTVYESIIEKHLPEMDEIYPDGYYFMHDNHKAHTYVEDWMEENDMALHRFPPYSPDLNIIENFWSTLKERVVSDAPHTEVTLVKSLQRNWEILTTPENLRPYFESLHDRYFECIEKEGHRLPY